MENDPLESFMEECQPNPSQEEELQNGSFANQDSSSEMPWFTSTDNQTQVESTGIVIVSLSGSSSDQNATQEVGEFQTPPENLQSQPSSSGARRPPPTSPAVKASEDLSNDADAMPVDDGCTEAERTVDLGRDSDVLGYSEPLLAQKIDGCINSSDLKSYWVNKGVFASNIDGNELVKVGNLEGELTKTLCKPVSEATSDSESPKVNKFGESDKLSKESEGFSVKKNIEDIEKSKYPVVDQIDQPTRQEDVAFGRRRRQLPLSIRREENDSLGKDCACSLTVKMNAWKDILIALSNDSEKTNESSQEVDLLETARSCGMTFSRPRWWPPEF